jgi:hypothetical protein
MSVLNIARCLSNMEEMSFKPESPRTGIYDGTLQPTPQQATGRWRLCHFNPARDPGRQNLRQSCPLTRSPAADRFRRPQPASARFFRATANAAVSGGVT